MIEKLILIALIKGALDKSLVEVAEDPCGTTEQSSYLAMSLQTWAWKELGLEVSLFDLLK